MKILIDRPVCQGHTHCALAAPDIVVLRDRDGHAEAVSEDIPPGLEERALKAARACPERAIFLF